MPQLRNRYEGLRNTAQSSCAKSRTVSKKFTNIKTYRDKLTLKQENSFRLLFENFNGLPPDMGYGASS